MMRNDIQPSLQTIKSYFDKKEFYIPSYQRPYAWKVAQCEQLIEDIRLHHENFDAADQDNYFFGTVLIAQDSGEDHEVVLIDGQQRTTTFMLLLKALEIKIGDELAKLSEDALEDARLIDKLRSLKNAIIDMLYNLDEDSLFNYKRGNYQLKREDIKYHNDSISESYKEDMFTILVNENFEAIKQDVIQIYRRQKDNRYTNFYKNFRYFYKFCEELTNTQVEKFAKHFVENCQVITITSYNTDQAINIFNSLNGTGLPLTPIEVIVSKTTAKAADRKVFESNWQRIVERTDHSKLDLNPLITHYIFCKLSEQNGGEQRNPGVREFFNKNNKLLENDEVFTDELNKILDNFSSFYDSELGEILGRFNGNVRPFVSSYMFFRNQSNYLEYLLKFFALLEITDFSYSSSRFKTFLEGINLKYSQVDDISEEDLVDEIKEQIKLKFDRSDIEERLREGGVATPLVYLNEYLYSKEKGMDFRLNENVDVEHIMSQSGLNRENIMKDAGFTNQDEFYEYAEKLGNKILLEAEINRGIGDAWFRTKKENDVTSRRGYVGSRYQIASSLANYPKDTWTKEDIDKATNKAATRIADFIFG